MRFLSLHDEAGSDARQGAGAPGDSAPRRPRRRFGWVRLTLDRSAVLVVGFAAGIGVGMSFDLHRPAPPPPPAAPAPTAAAAMPPAPLPPVNERAIDPRVLARVQASGKVRVGVFGDSFGVGVWEALDAQLPRESGFQVLRFAKEATGFTQYHRLNLATRAQEQLAADPVDVAVICFGANDTVPFYAEGKEQPLLSAGWKRVVGARIDRFVAVARSTGASVYWLGLPAMRDPGLDASIQAMNAFYAEHMRALGVPFLETRSRSVDAAGRYAAYLPDDKTGARKLVRTNDGLHMLGVGYQRITAGLAGRIETLAQRMRREGAAEAAAK
ncbi:GDSL-type esterase/lipase family protein [Sphingomonas elodea]|uniref:SGNH/GDSL hydrolase family protein n=1 Tax=Sphingomonas elodea TaxID=179878 RepID=UPI0002630AA6|nr:GDSL-type esterase/lipase family protein [Sphingomonas elodea]